MKKITILTASLLLSFVSFAQKYEIGKVSNSELTEKQYAKDAAAPAAVLYKKGETTFDFDNSGNWVIVTEVEARVKIYSKEGYKYATVEVPYYVGVAADSQQEVNFLEGYTYNMVNGKPEKTKIKKENEFTEDYSDKVKVKKLTMPSVKEGSVIEYRYQLRSPFLRSIPTWYFQGELPISHIEFDVRVPQYFVYNRILSPYVAIKEKQDTKQVTKRYGSSTVKGGYGNANGSLANETGSITYYEVSREYTADNVPALSDESYVDNIKNYLSFVKHELATTHFPNQEERNYAADWEAVAKSVFKDEDFGNQIEASGYFETELDAALKAAAGKEEKVNTVYNFVRDRMAFNGKYDYEVKTGVKKAYAAKSGNVAEINLMLIAMLRHAGINADPVLLSTRQNGHVSFVNRSEFDYVIAAVEKPGGYLFLDATDKQGIPGILPLRALNGTGRLVKPTGSSQEVDLMPATSSKENVIVIGEVAANGKVTGQVRAQYTDYRAFFFRDRFENLSETDYVALMEKSYKNAEISDYKKSIIKDSPKPVTEDYNFSTDQFVEVIGDKMYISPLLFFTDSQNPFKAETRNYPIDFTYPKLERYTVSLTIPDGYVVESLPESVQLGSGANIGSYRSTVAAKGNQIQIMVTQEVNVARVNPEFYSGLKAYYGDIIKKQNEKIILKKA